MVVTFVIGSLEYTCAHLDKRRLNKQKVEASQILKAIEGQTTGWVNHPAAKMWRGYASALKHYFNTITLACIARGFKNNMPLFDLEGREVVYQTVHDYCAHGVPADDDARIVYPWWFTWEPLIQSHRASLLRKDPEHYKPLFQDQVQEPYISTGYVWPAKLTQEQILHFKPDYCDPIGAGAPANYRWTKEQVLEWIKNPLVNPKTKRAIKPTKSGIYADLTKAAKIWIGPQFTL